MARKNLRQINFSYEQDLANPGDYPFTKGHPSARIQEQGMDDQAVHRFGTPKETNQRFRLMISHGQTGL